MNNASKILPIVLVALILVSAVQAFQLNALKEKLAGGKLSVSTALPASVNSGGAAASSGSGASGATGLSNLPTMVGGC